MKQMSDYKLKPDEIPWLHIAMQILNGEFNGSDESTIKSLKIGLRSIDHPTCKQALEALRKIE